MSDFAGEVRQALENIPHTRQCYSTRLGDLGEVEAKVCICDREARIAAAVARAIAAAGRHAMQAGLNNSLPGHTIQVPGTVDETYDAALQALGEAPRP